MIVLGIDTSAYANAIGVVDGNGLLADALIEARSDSLQKIVLNVESTLKHAGLTMDNVQGFGVGLGPGSWTGIRVGVTVAKMLAFATGESVCGIATLDALAYQARDDGKEICSIISVGAGDNIYAGLYRVAGNDITRIGDYYVGGLDGLAEKLSRNTVLAGPEASDYSRALSGKVGGLEVREGAARGSTIALMAAARLEKGQSDDALALTPLYLKESTAKAFTGRYSGAGGERG